jgi:hypothetical protein
MPAGRGIRKEGIRKKVYGRKEGKKEGRKEGTKRRLQEKKV